MERKGSCIFGMMAGRIVVGMSIDIVAGYPKGQLCVVERVLHSWVAISTPSPKWLDRP